MHAADIQVLLFGGDLSSEKVLAMFSSVTAIDWNSKVVIPGMFITCTHGPCEDVLKA